MAKKKEPSDEDRVHGRSREVKHVVNQMSDVDFFDYRLVVRSSGIQELMMGHTGLRQGLVYVESLVEETRAGNYAVAYAQLLRSLQIFEDSYNQIRRALVDLGEYYDDHPIEVREINHGLTEMCDGCDNLVKSVVALKQTKTGESLELSKRALTHLREAAHRIGSHLRDIKDCCPSNIEFEVLDIRENEARIARQMEGAKPVQMQSCHSSHGPGEPCNQQPNAGKVEGEKPDALPVKIESKRAPAENPVSLSNHDEETAQLAQQLKEHQVSLEKITESLEADPDSSIAKTVARFARSVDDESAMEDLMRKVSENRARTIDKLVADARAAKAEAIASINYVPVPGEAVPGMQPMSFKNEARRAVASEVSSESKMCEGKTDSGADSEKDSGSQIEKKSAKLQDKSTPVMEKSEPVEKSEKTGKSSEKASRKVLQKALQKAKEKNEKRPLRKVSGKSEAGTSAAVPPEKKKKREELVDELTFDDTGMDFNKAGK